MTPVVLASTQIWWFTARAGGLVAWALSALAVLWGLALSTRALGRKPRAPWLLDLHRFLGGLSVIFVLVHLVALWADSYVQFSLTQLLVPFASTYKTWAVAWGVVAFYLLVAVELTSLVMKRLPKQLWKGVHFSSYAMYLFATVHLLTAGTDSRVPALRWSVIATIGAVVFFTVYRIIGPGRRGSIAPAKRAQPTST
jgi:predicted ferric reductase